MKHELTFLAAGAAAALALGQSTAFSQQSRNQNKTRMAYPSDENPVLVIEQRGDGEIRAGSEYSYTLHVRNVSDQPLHDVRVHQILPSSFQLESESLKSESQEQPSTAGQDRQPRQSRPATTGSGGPTTNGEWKSTWQEVESTDAEEGDVWVREPHEPTAHGKTGIGRRQDAPPTAGKAAMHAMPWTEAREDARPVRPARLAGPAGRGTIARDETARLASEPSRSAKPARHVARTSSPARTGRLGPAHANLVRTGRSVNRHRVNNNRPVRQTMTNRVWTIGMLGSGGGSADPRQRHSHARGRVAKLCFRHV